MLKCYIKYLTRKNTQFLANLDTRRRAMIGRNNPHLLHSLRPETCNVLTQMSTSVRRTTEDAASMPTAQTTSAALFVPVCTVTRETDSRA